jgi:hypothetical protein
MQDMELLCSSSFAAGIAVVGAVVLVAGWRMAIIANRSFLETASPVIGKVMRIKISTGRGRTSYTAIVEVPGERFAVEVVVPREVGKQLRSGDELIVYRHPRKSGKYVQGELNMQVAHPATQAIWNLGFLGLVFGLALFMSNTFSSPLACI